MSVKHVRCPRRALAVVMLGCIGLAALGGCGEEARDTGAPRRVTSGSAAVIDVPPSLRPRELPLRAFDRTPREAAILDYANQLLIAKCMTGQGFRARVPKFEDLADYNAVRQQLDDAELFGLTDLGAARKYGYAEPPIGPAPTAYFDRSTAAARAAFAGDGSAGDVGCAGRATMRLYDSDSEITTSPLSESLAVQAYERAQAKPAWGAAVRDFGACLRQAGYDVPDPEKPFASESLAKISKNARSRASGEGAKPPQSEIKLAVADVECKVETDLVERQSAVLIQQQNRLIDTNALALDEADKEKDAALKRAAKVMSGEDLS